MAESKNNKKRCSFCGRTENEVGFLITGMNGYICDSCATQAYEITQEALGVDKKGAETTKLNLKELPKPVEIKKFLHHYGGKYRNWKNSIGTYNCEAVTCAVYYCRCYSAY